MGEFSEWKLSRGSFPGEGLMGEKVYRENFLGCREDIPRTLLNN